MGQAGTVAGAFCPGLSWASDISFLHSQVLCLHSTQQGEAVHFPESLTILWVPSGMRGTQKTDHASMGEGTTLPLILSELFYGIVQGLMEGFGP